MSRDVYGGGGGSGAGGGVAGGSGRSPRTTRRDLNADPYYQEGPPRPHSPGAAARRSRSATRAVSPTMAMDPHGSYMDPHGPPLESDRRSGSAPGSHHRSRSQSRTNPGRNFHSLDRDPHEREFMPIRDPRDRSMERGGPPGPAMDRGPGFDRGPGMDRGPGFDSRGLDRGLDRGLERGPGPGGLDMHSMSHGRRDRSLDRGALMEDDLYRDPHGMPGGRARTSPNHAPYGPGPGMGRGDPYLLEVQMENADMQKELGNLKKELEHTNRKLGTSMHSIKTFWSPELKKERALRKEESAKYSLINDQLKLFNSENQKQAMLVRQLEEELRIAKMRGPSTEIQTQVDVLVTENEHLSKEASILRETIKELELRIETQKQTLSARDESIKKLLEMLQQKGMGSAGIHAESNENRMLHVVGDKSLEGESSVELEQTRARLLECQNEMDRMRELLQMRDLDVDQLRQEAREVGDRLRRSQEGLWGVNTPAGASLTALLDTKDARIMSLEREVGLLQSEVSRLRDAAASSTANAVAVAVSSGGGGSLTGSRWGSRASLATPPPPTTDDSRLLQVMQERERKTKLQLEEARQEVQRRDQEILALSAKMKTLEEQHQDYTRHIMVLKESLLAKEEHYNMLQADVEELRTRLEEKNKTIEKKTQHALQATQERNRLSNEANELRDHMDIKDRKINVLQRKLDLHDAMKSGHSAEEVQQAKRHVEDQMRGIDQRQRNLDTRNRQLDERERTLTELETRLQKKREQLDNLETQLSQVSHGEGIPTPEANKQLNEMRRALGDQENMLDAITKEKKHLQDELRSAQSETERLLQVMRMGQEEQFAKDNAIKELQDALNRERGGRRGTSPGPSPSMQQLGGGLGGGLGGLGPGTGPGPSPAPGLGTGPGPMPSMQQVPQDQSRPPSATPSSKLDGIAAPLSGAVPANLAATAGKATASAQEAAKATFEQAKNVAQEDAPKMSIPEEDLQNKKVEHYLNSRDELEILEIEGRERECKLHVDQLEVDIKLKDSLIQTLIDENKKERDRVEELEEEIHSLEEELKRNDKLEELEDLVVVVKQKNERIEELEEALRQSVRIASDMELEKIDEEDRRKEITEKLEKLELRLFGDEFKDSTSCVLCPLLKDRFKMAEGRLENLLSERRRHLEELFDMKHEALTASISEKDAHLALLEMNGVRNARTAQQVQNLTAERAKLTERIKNQSEERIRLLQQFAALDKDATSPMSSPVLSQRNNHCSKDTVTTHL